MPQGGSLIRPSPPASQAEPKDKQLLALKLSKQLLMEHFDNWRNSVPSMITSNQNLSPIIEELTDANLAYQGQDTSLGHCSTLVRRTRASNGIVEHKPVVRERGSNNDSPRVHIDGRKIYAYHVAAAYYADSDPREGLTEELLRSVPANKLAGVQDVLTVMHLCGNKWCLTRSHLAVGLKTYNDEQTACHRGLQSAKSVLDTQAVLDHYCRHSVKCWSLNYSGIYSEAGRHHWT